MPDWLVSLLQKEQPVKSEGVVGVLAQLLEQCSSTNYAYLCHPCVQHISKLKKEGTFLMVPFSAVVLCLTCTQVVSAATAISK